MVADVWGAGELHNGAGGSYRYRGDGDSLVMFETGLQVVGDEGDRCRFWRRDCGDSKQEQLGTGCLGGAEAQSAEKLYQAPRAAGKQRFWWVCIRGTLSHTCSNKRLLGKTHRFPKLEKGPRNGSRCLRSPAGPKSQLPLPYTQPAGSLIHCLLPVSLQPERLATLAALLCTSGPRAIEGRRGTDFGRPGNPTDRHCGSGEPREGPGPR